ncbi:THO complex subunit mft1 [Fulvia fulva]|nr:THO complex subunit mft1 [Fulvia fulva]KAK4614681.1 THO complex subunit mft1 [Fulvia fulva]WPV20794.1 THO complex subunit mft1 [Fulvia fulva]WPV35344.1 THO complex subunit mft1 [Fulvia fulva]
MADQDIQQLTPLPEQAQEDALHATRLLAIEERPFQRVTNRLVGKNSILRPSLTYLPSPPPEGEEEFEFDAQKVQKFREEVLIDFANLESSIVRIQLILSSNERERERYAEEKAKILETAQAVRENTIELRGQLVQAQQVLEQRKGYDKEAAKILNDKNLKSRDETKADIEKLEKEIEDLQHESAQYEETWVTRREHFDNVVREGENMIKLIKGIKDEPEKDETMDDADDDAKADTSRMGTPAPEGRSPQPTDTGDRTPMVGGGGDVGDATPRPTNKFLEVDDATRSNSRIASPSMQATQSQDDVDMGDASLSISGEPQQPSKTSEGMDVAIDQVATPQGSTPAADIAMDGS